MKLKKQFKLIQSDFLSKINSLEGNTKEKYKQIHVLFEEIKQERKTNLMNTTMTKKKKRNVNQLMMADNSSKIITLK